MRIEECIVTNLPNKLISLLPIVRTHCTCVLSQNELNPIVKHYAYSVLSFVL